MASGTLHNVLESIQSIKLIVTDDLLLDIIMTLHDRNIDLFAWDFDRESEW